ncbi:MAG: aldo/keto reductase [Cyanobacteria bacterium P01_H01_bin.15]
MQYRRFGRTGLELSVFSLGTMRGLTSLAQFTTTVDTAIANGINHLETARGYGDSEEYLGKALRSLNISREQVVLTSKFLPVADASVYQFWLEESLARLQCDYLDCVAIHGLNTSEHLAWSLRSGGCMDVLQKFVAQGKIRHLGFSSHGSLELIQTVIASGRFEFVNLHYYYFFQRHAAALAQAAAADMGIFIISPTDKGGQLFAPSAKLQALTDPLSPQAFNYRFLLAEPRITTLSLGASRPDELTAAFNLCDRVEPFTATEQRIQKRLQASAIDSLGTSHCHQCYACLPCPEDINIPEVLRLRNLDQAYDLTSFGKYRYAMFENAGHWFPGRRADRCNDCGDCLPRCPHELNIPELLRATHERLQGPRRRRLWEE